VLIGPSGSGKSTFAARHFLPTEVISSDFCRGLVSDNENDQAATGDAFEVLHFIAGKRLAAGKMTVVDATSVRPEDRRPLVSLAKQYHCLPVAIVFNLPPAVCLERNASRPDRDFGPHVVRQQNQSMRRSLKSLRREGFRHTFELHSPDEVEGMVGQALPFIARGQRGYVQPAVKCRGVEYLRIIYGPDYAREEDLQRLRSRGLWAKRSLAIREFALGIEGLERFVRGEPLRRVHECVFGVLAMESEPVDPRL
jgi:predicted kinase